MAVPDSQNGASLYTTNKPALARSSPVSCGKGPSGCWKARTHAEGCERGLLLCPSHPTTMLRPCPGLPQGGTGGRAAASVGALPAAGLLLIRPIPGLRKPLWPLDNSRLLVLLLRARLPPVRNLRSGIWQNALFSHTRILKGYRPCVCNRQNIRSLVSLRTIIRFARGQVDTKNLSRPGLWMGLSPPLKLMKFSTRGYLS